MIYTTGIIIHASAIACSIVILVKNQNKKERFFVSIMMVWQFISLIELLTIISMDS